MILLESYQMIGDTLYHSHFLLRVNDNFYHLKRLQLTAYARPSHSNNVDGLSTATLCLNSVSLLSSTRPSECTLGYNPNVVRESPSSTLHDSRGEGILEC